MKKDDSYKSSEDIMEETMMSLIFDAPFYANLLLNMNRQFRNDIPTLGVSVTDKVNLYVNEFFFAAMTPEERVEVLKHECHHVIHNHFVRFRDLEPQIFDSPEKKTIMERVQSMQNASVMNQAADYAINEYLPNLPKKMKFFDKDGVALKYPEGHKDAGKVVTGSPCLVKELRKEVKNAEYRQTTEYYYELLQKENEDDKDGKGEGGNGKGMVIDDHSLWHESDASEDQITDVVKDMVNRAVETTKERAIGSLPADILAAIEQLNHVPKDWRQDLQRFVARQVEILVENTRKKRNRRYGILYPGIKKEPKMHLAVAVDSSGSVNDEELVQFFSEINRIHNLNVDITIIECDARVNNVYKYDPKRKISVSGRGGTAFSPVFERIQEDKMDIDGLIYLTDGGCYESELKKPKYPVMWALLKGYDCPIKWGSRTTVEVKKKVRR